MIISVWDASNILEISRDTLDTWNKRGFINFNRRVNGLYKLYLFQYLKADMSNATAAKIVEGVSFTEDEWFLEHVRPNLKGEFQTRTIDQGQPVLCVFLKDGRYTSNVKFSKKFEWTNEWVSKFDEVRVIPLAGIIAAVDEKIQLWEKKQGGE